MKKIRIFISSPGDLKPERIIAFNILKELEKQYEIFEPFEIFLSELFASEGKPVPIQEQLPNAAEFDIFVCMVWNRMGTPLPESAICGNDTVELRGPDGEIGLTGTEYEFLWALNGWSKRGLPRILVYRKSAPPTIALKNSAETEKLLRDQKRVEEFEKRFINTEGTYISARHSFPDELDFEELFRAHARQLVKDVLKDRRHDSDAVDRARPPAIWVDRCPFRGLKRFEPSHSKIFFGRTRLIRQLVWQLGENQKKGVSFLLVLGASGSGKSSVVRAGLIPAVMGGNSESQSRFSRSALVFSLESGMSPSEVISREVLTNGADSKGPSGCQASSFGSAVELAKRLIDDPGYVAAEVAIWQSEVLRGQKNGQGEEALLFFDQFEQLFDPQVPDNEKLAVCRFIKSLATSRKVSVVVAMRSDFYAEFHALTELQELASQTNSVDVYPPSPAETDAIIRRGVEAAGLEIEQSDTSDDLVNLILTETAKTPECLPLLSLCLEQVYLKDCVEDPESTLDLVETPHKRKSHVLSLSTYKDMGGLAGAVETLALELQAELTDAEFSAHQFVFWFLVDISDEQSPPVSRAIDMRLLSTNDTMQKFVQKCADHRLLTVRAVFSDESVNWSEAAIAHESLLELWPLLARWIKYHRSLLPMRARIESSAKRWATVGNLPELLLPSGLPMNEAEKLKANSVPLSRLADQYIDASKQKQFSFRTRLLGSALAAVAFLFLAAIGAGIFYWDGYVSLKTRYYETYVLKWGLPHGINEIEADAPALSDTATSFAFVRKGRYGPLQYVVCLKAGKNSTSPDNGQVEVNPDIERFGVIAVNYSGVDDMGRPENLVVAYDDVNPGPGALTRVYSKDLKEVEFRGADDDLDSILHLPMGGNRVFGDILGEHESRSQVSRCFLTYSDEGFIEAIDFKDGNNQPASTGGRVFGLRFKRNSLGHITEEIYVDRKGQRTNSLEGFARRVFNYDKRNRVTELRRYNSADRLFGGTSDSGICAITRYEHDDVGNLHRQHRFDADLNPDPHKTGWTSIEFGYKDGEPDLTRYLGKDRLPVLTTEGIAEIRWMFSEDGKQFSKSFYGTKREKILTVSDGYHKVIVTRDVELDADFRQVWNESRELYYDTNLEPCVSKQTNSYEKRLRTENLAEFLVVTESYHDQNGDPMKSDARSGLAAMRHYFSLDMSRLLKEEYLDEQLELTIDKESGTAGNETTYDDLGNVKTIVNFGLDRKRCTDRSGIAEIRFRYVAGTADLEEKTYHDEHGNLTIANDEGYAKSKLIYDGRGNLRERAFFDDVDILVDHKVSGIARHVYDVEGVGRIKSERFLKSSGELVLNKSRGFAAVTRDYSGDGKIVSMVFTKPSHGLPFIGNPAGTAIVQLDEDGRLKEVAFFKEDGKSKSLGACRAHRIKFDYDEFESMSVRAFGIDEKKLALAGLAVTEVLEDGVAATFELKQGDQFIAVSGVPIIKIVGDDAASASERFIAFRSKLSEEHTLTILRDGEELEKTVKAGLLGIRIEPTFE